MNNRNPKSILMVAKLPELIFVLSHDLFPAPDAKIAMEMIDILGLPCMFTGANEINLCVKDGEKDDGTAKQAIITEFYCMLRGDINLGKCDHIQHIYDFSLEAERAMYPPGDRTFTIMTFLGMRPVARSLMKN